jgi:flagellar biosynthesis protein FlhG
MTLAVTSGKGGVGKSNISVNLSICLALRGLRVTLVDVDMGLANADLLMNIQPRYTLAHVVSGRCGVGQVCTDGPGGIQFVPGASGLHDLANLSEFERRSLIAQLRELENNTDIMVLDCGAGVSKNVTSFALAADRVVVVTTPEPPAMTDAYVVIKTLHRTQCNTQVGLFVNMANGRPDAAAVHRRLAEVARRFLKISVADLGYMLQDTAVELAVQERCPFVIRYPSSNASACIAAMADQVARACVGRQRRGGFFKRVVGLFV